MNAAVMDTLAMQMVSGFGQYATDRDGSNPDALKTINFYEVRDLVDAPQQVEKPLSQWLIPSTHKSRKNHDKNGLRPLVWADLDEPTTTTIQQTAEIVRRIVGGCDFEVYASRSATEAKQKCRILIPLAEALPPKQWFLVAEVFDAKLTQAGFKTDRAALKLGQVLYLPNRGEFYDASSARDGELFEPLMGWAAEIAERKAEIERQAAEVKQAQEAARTRREALKASRSTSGFKSPIEAFNAAYDVSEVLTRNGYKQRGNTFRHPASESGNFSASVRTANDGVSRVHSLSTSDPLHTAGAGAHDAFSAFCILEHNGDEKAAIRDAADNWLTIGGESWNKVQRREWGKQQQEQQRNVEPVFGQLDHETGELMQPEQPKPKRLIHVDVLGVWSDPSPEPEFVWGKYLPKGTTTLFGAHGGTGKSTIGLMLAVAVAAGLPLLGVETVAAPSIFVSLEDGASIVRHRLGAICRWLEVNPATLAGRLFVVDGTEHPELYGADNRSSEGSVSDTYAELRELVESTGAGLVLIDNASDAYASDEILRRHVRAFIRHLNLIAKRSDAAVVLLSHVDKSTSKSKRPENGEGYSGSTAWHNSVRSRLFLSRDEDSGLLTLEHQKSNYGRKQDPLLLSWPENGFPRAHQQGDAPDYSGLMAKVEGRAQDANAAEVLKMLAEFEGRGQFASTELSARNNVYAVLKSEPQLKRLKIGKDTLQAIINQCQRAGWIEPLEYRSPHRKTLTRWTVTDEGRDRAGLQSAPTAPTAPTPNVSAEGA